MLNNLAIQNQIILMWAPEYGMAEIYAESIAKRTFIGSNLTYTFIQSVYWIPQEFSKCVHEKIINSHRPRPFQKDA